MPTFVLLEADQFDAVLDRAASSQAAEAAATTVDKESVRRPLRGHEIPLDTYATLQVWRANKVMKPLADSGGKYEDPNNSRNAVSYAYANFIVEAVQESREEKMQIVETFGDDYAFFFGERPRFVQVSGQLVNTPDFNWRSEWWHNYEENFRGSKLVRDGARLYFTYESIILEGYMVSSSTSQTAQFPRSVPFNFSMWITGRRDISAIGDSMFPGYGTKSAATLGDIRASQTYGGSGAVPRGLAVRESNAIANAGAGISGIVDAISWVLDYVSVGMSYMNFGIDWYKNMVLGKQVRIPPGFAGSELMTQDSQGATNVLGEGEYSYIGLSQPITQAMLQLPGDIAIGRTLPTRGNIYEQNWDEYVQGGSKTLTTDWRSEWAKAAGIIPKDGFEKLMQVNAGSAELDAQARAAFAEYGLDPDVYLSEDLLFLANAAFRVTNFAISLASVADQQSRSGAGYGASSYLEAEEYNRTTYHNQTSDTYDIDLYGMNFGGNDQFGEQADYDPNADQIDHGDYA